MPPFYNYPQFGPNQFMQMPFPMYSPDQIKDQMKADALQRSIVGENK